MADTPVFQGHHVIEQAAFRQSRLLQSLERSGLFDLHGPRNILNLPADQALAARMGLSPHPGGPLGAYTDELATALRDLQISPDGQATLRGDQAAAQRMAARVNGLTDTLKVGLVNGDLVSNTPQGMTPEQANARIRTFYGDLDGYQRSHAGQIAELGRMTGSEARWAGVTQSEGNVRSALDAIDQPGRSTVSDRWGGRQSLGTAIADANQAGRLPLSEPLAARLRVAFPQEIPPVLARPPTVPRLPGAPGEGGILTGEGIAPEAPGPRGSAAGARVLGAAGVALMAYDFAVTGHRVVQLRAEGNETAAASAQTHFVGRNAGGIVGGFLLGAGYGAVTGSWTGPGAIATGLVGGVAGAYLGERWADQQDINRIFTQPDSSGNEWARNPEDPEGAWTRTVGAPTPNGGHQETRLIAAGRLVDELNYRAANDSYSLGLGSPPRPQAPYRLDASAETHPPRAPFETGRDYVRDAQTGRWQLEIRENLDGRIPITRNEPVSPEHATDLERQSQRIIAQNAANTPAAIAARYQIAYNQYDWNEFAAREPVPPVIANANPQTMLASDGSRYTRDGSGEWSTPGMLYGTSQATGNIREELDRTWQSQQVGLQDMAAMAEVARANPTPTQNDLRTQVAGAYVRAGVTRSDAQIDAATTAVAQDHASDGVTASQAPFFLQLQTDGVIATVIGQDDNRMEIRSTTTAAEISQAERQQTRPPETPQSNAPARSSQTQQPSAPAPEAPQPSAPSLPTEPRRSSFQEGRAPELVAPTIATAGLVAPTAASMEGPSSITPDSPVQPQSASPARISESATPGAPAPAMTSHSIASTSPDSPPADQLSPDRHSPAGPKLEDAAIVEQMRLSVAKLDEKASKPWDERSEQMVASAYKLAVEAGFKAGDNVEVALSLPTKELPAGANLFVWRSGAGASPDPAANRAHMPASEALAASPEQQYQAANQTRDAQEQTRLQELAHAQDRGPDDPNKSGPKMS